MHALAFPRNVTAPRREAPRAAEVTASSGAQIVASSSRLVALPVPRVGVGSFRRWRSISKNKHTIVWLIFRGVDPLVQPGM
jgi:hypothetical protein